MPNLLRQFNFEWTGGLTTSRVFLALAVVMSAGCSEQEPILQYTIAKPLPTTPAPIPQRETGDMGPARPSAARGPNRLLGAIVPRGERTWFFKLSGSTQAVTEQGQAFVSFVQSLRFNKGNPDWDLPDGWEQNSGPPPRYATIRIATEGSPLELTVSELPTAEGSFDDYVLSNINRWRGQLQLPPLAADQLEEVAVKFPVADEQGWLVKLDGMSGAEDGPKGSGSKTSRSSSDNSTPPAVPDRPRLPFAAVVPEQWTQAAANQMQVAAYEVRDGDQTVSITISTAGGDLLPNINRWRGQIQLPPLAGKSELNDLMEKIPMGKVNGDYFYLVGPEGADPREAILGVVAKANGQQWFFKLKGSATLTAKEKERFENFVRSIRFSGPGGE